MFSEILDSHDLQGKRIYLLTCLFVQTDIISPRPYNLYVRKNDLEFLILLTLPSEC